MFRFQSFDLTPAYENLFSILCSFQLELKSTQSTKKPRSFDIESMLAQPKIIPKNFPKKLYPCYILVHGGWIRDKLLNRETKDLDIMLPSALLKQLTNYIEKKSGNQFEFIVTKTLKLNFDNLINADLYIAQYTYGDEVIDIDLLGLSGKPNDELWDQMISKDFTCNSFFYDVLNKMVFHGSDEEDYLVYQEVLEYEKHMQ